MKKDPKNAKLFKDIEIVGRHNGENPNGTLIVAKSVSQDLRKTVQDALLTIETDTSAKAVAVKESLGVKKYVVTTEKDFKFTIPMLKDAGVTKDFIFTFDKTKIAAHKKKISSH